MFRPYRTHQCGSKKLSVEFIAVTVQSTEIYPAQMEKVDNLKKGFCQKGLEVKMSRHL